MNRPRTQRAASDSIAARARQSSASGPKGAESPPLPELRPGQSVELLKELHILTREGKLNQDSRRKLKQVGHLVQFIEKIVGELEPQGEQLTLADHGAGKSYLGFILYDLLLKAQGSGTVYGIETRPELVDRSRALAERLGFERMRFLNIAAADAAHDSALPERFDIVTALHACDTATDDAIAFGLEKKRRPWCWSPAARPSWPPACGSRRRCNCRARRWPSCGATRCTRAKWAAN